MSALIAVDMKVKYEVHHFICSYVINKQPFFPLYLNSKYLTWLKRNQSTHIVNSNIIRLGYAMTWRASDCWHILYGIWPIYITLCAVTLWPQSNSGHKSFLESSFATTWSASSRWHPALVTARFRQHVLQLKTSKSKTLGKQAGIKTPTMHWHIVGQPWLAEVTVWELSANIACDSRRANAGNVAQECFSRKVVIRRRDIRKELRCPQAVDQW